jgi:hypothetical protein
VFVSATEQEATLGGGLGAIATRPTPPIVRPAVYGRRQREQWVLAVAVAAVVPLVIHGAYGYNLAVNACFYAILSVGFFYQFVLAGQFSFATPSFYAVGAYTYIWTSRHLGGFLVGFLAAAVITALLGAAVKLVLARSPLIHFSIATLAMGALGVILLRNTCWRSGESPGPAPAASSETQNNCWTPTWLGRAASAPTQPCTPRERGEGERTNGPSGSLIDK